MTQTIVQIFLIAVSVIAVFTIINPNLENIGQTQDEIDEYSLAVESAYATNQSLNALVQKVDSFSQQENYKLNRFIPESIDPIRTAFDIEVLVENNNLFLVSIDVQDEVQIQSPVVTSNPVQSEDFIENQPGVSQIAQQDFDISVAGTYEQFKAFLADIESSAQLFEVKKVSFQSTSSDITQFNLSIRVFGLNPSIKNL